MHSDFKLKESKFGPIKTHQNDPANSVLVSFIDNPFINIIP